MIKTPVRYPGGKSRMVTYLGQFVPDTTTWTEYREPFVGGSSMFLYMRQKYPGKRFWINDKYYNLYCFWTSLRDHCSELVDIITTRKTQYPDKESGKDLFLLEKALLDQSDKFHPLDVAAAFYIVNKTSFSGLTQDSRYAPMAYDQNFGWGVIKKFPQVSALLQGVRITNLDYTELLEDNSDAFIYLDPPYDIKYALYGGNKGELHRGFDHLELSDKLSYLHSAKWMLSYNDNPELRELYISYPIDDGFKGHYTMNCPRTESGAKKSKGNSEIIIRNFSASIQSSLFDTDAQTESLRPA